ncbi:response regulator [Planctomycetota bacterium]
MTAESSTPSEQAVILLVDDNPVNLQVLFQTLNGEGYKLLVAKNGIEALRIAQQAHPQLILLDIQMPEMDGYQACQELQDDPETRDIAILFLSALQATEEKVRGLSLGAVDFITKPFDVNEVLARVKRQLEVYYQHQQLKIENQRLLTQTEREGLSPTEREQWVRDLIAQGESEHVEFKSTLRWDLKQDKTHPGVETAWLKSIVAFLNSDGGTLIVGVDDDGNTVGYEKDNFKSMDKHLLHVNNKIQDHIGLEHAQCIRFALEPIDGSQILVVECTPSKDPVFLSQGKDEQFYIRVGPGSRKLSTRQVLEYVTKRQQAHA